MSGQRQKNRPEQGVLAFPTESRSEAPKAVEKGTETLVAKRRPESLAETERLMEEVCEWENCKQALQRVKANKGSAGVDGMTVQQLPDYLKQHGPEIREQLLTGNYEPKPVRRVEIPKPDGGMRKLGIPSVLDRFVQQAVLQVLQKRWDPTFSEHSHGFRPGRSARKRCDRHSSISPKGTAGWWTGSGAIFWCARLSPALSAGEIPAPERGRAAPPGIESWAHGGNDMS